MHGAVENTQTMISGQKPCAAGSRGPFFVYPPPLIGSRIPVLRGTNATGRCSKYVGLSQAAAGGKPGCARPSRSRAPEEKSSLELARWCRPRTQP